MGEMGDVNDMVLHVQRFSWVDYLVFMLMLAISAVVGVYWGFMKKQTTQNDYLLGGRNMKVVPVSMSLVASFVSGITLLGSPTEVYIYGTQYAFIMGGIFLMSFVMAHVYLPVFHELKITSNYEGGLQAVVWTDVIQITAMFAAMALVAIKGTIDVGGIGVVWQRNMESGRIDPPKKELSDSQANWLMRGVVVLLGTLCVGLVFVVEKMGTVLQLTMTLEAMTMGPQLGVFSMGILMPWVDATGALVGGISGLATMAWWCLTAQMAIARGLIVHPHKNLTTTGCQYNYTIIETATLSNEQTDEVNPLLRVSYMWYTLAGAVVTICVGAAVSRVNRVRGVAYVPPASSLLAPQLRKLYKEPPHPTDEPYIRAYGHNKVIWVCSFYITYTFIYMYSALYWL
ncbi:unnamed protein product [Diatraea saccharalis]|uniref:Sodium-coupled monocarboxylate transporter 1 n=1 Tax=Diatraea saccharalis TaxID=40085 RepID=A0A9N9RH50_9NEOP|nr:unnamed protein product [Diatraea saccharalis]